MSDKIEGDGPIRFERVNKWYGDSFHVLRDIDLYIGRGERLVICGPSGSGKSTLIRCINGLEAFQEGRLVVDGIHLASEGAEDDRAIAAVRQRVGMVLQQFNLFPHLTVLGNLTLAPVQVRGVPRRQAGEEALAQLARVKLAEQAPPGEFFGAPGSERTRDFLAKILAH